jgi:putative nucleotidyltransferase with HDIG domain
MSANQPDSSPQADFSLYQNRWVAVVHGRIIGVGLTREQAYRAAKRIRPKDKPEMWFVDETGQPKQTMIAEQVEKIIGRLQHYPLLQQTLQILRQRQIEAYLVGGPVRDLLLERDKIGDFDFVIPQDGVAVARRVANALDAAFYPLDLKRDTGRVVYQADDGSAVYLDFAAFRGPSLEADLRDRDFTINAIALNLTEPLQLIDPLNGQDDLAAGQIRACSEATFHNDPVRVLRAIRQTVQFDFEIETQTAQKLSEGASKLQTISPERQRDELMKLLNTPLPGQAVEMLRRFGVLPYILPEVATTIGVDQSPPHHLDVFGHTLAALDAWADLARSGWSTFPDNLQPSITAQMSQPIEGQLSQQLLMPLALLLHDVGKPLTRAEEKVEGQLKIRFLGHERESAKIARQVMRRLRFSQQAVDFVERVVLNHLRPLLLAAEGKVSRRATYHFFRDTGQATFQAGIATALHALADHAATYPPGQGQAEEQVLWSVVHHLVTAFFEQQSQVVNPPLLLTGRDLMETFGLPQGPLIGLLLRRLQEAQAIGQVTDKMSALAFINNDPDFANWQKGEL